MRRATVPLPLPGSPRMSTGTSAWASNSACARSCCMMGLTWRKNSSSPRDSMSSLAISASASSFDVPRCRRITDSSWPSLSGRTSTSLAPRRVASFCRFASSGSQSTTIGSSGRSRRSQGKSWRPSASPPGASSNNRWGAAPNCTRSIASQPLGEVSRSQELDCAVLPSRRSIEASLLTTSSRSVSVVFAAMFDRPFSGRSRRGSPDISGRFDFVSFYAYRQRALDCLYRNNQRAVPITRDQYALHAVECSAPDTPPLANLEVWMGRPGQLGFDQTSNRVDLGIWNRCALAASPDQCKNSVNAENAKAVHPVRYEFGEHVTAEQ